MDAFVSVVLVEPSLSHLDRAFTYSADPTVGVGSLVRVRFRGRPRTGVVVERLAEASVDTVLPVGSVLGPGLPEALVDLARWTARRYCATFGEALAAIVPARVASEEPGETAAPAASPPPDRSMFDRYEGAGAMFEGRGGAFLWRPLVEESRGAAISALTGAALAAGAGAIVLTPEVRVRSEVAATVRAALGEQVAWLGSDASARERYRAWLALRSGARRVAAGGRAAVFAPVSGLGLIVIDDEAHAAYKEGRAPRFHARTIAAERARREGATLVLVGTPPSVESRVAAQTSAVTLVAPPRDAERRSRSPVQVIERGDERLTPSSRTMTAVKATLGRGERVVVLTHRRDDALDAVWERVHRIADAARRPVSLHAGVRVPELARAARTADLIVATPVIAKDLALEGIGLVAICDADAALARPDFRAAEETFAVWWHAARWCAGRGALLVETANPAHPAVEALVRWDPDVLHRSEASRRRETGYPPFAATARVDAPSERAGAAAAALRAAGPDLEVLGPAERGDRSVVVVRATRRERLLEVLEPVASAWRANGEPMRVDVDPWEVLDPRWRS